MAKAKKRVATRKKNSKRRKPSAKAVRKGTARKKRTSKRTTPKTAKSRIRRGGKSAPKSSAGKKKLRSKTTARKVSKKASTTEATNVAEIPVETTIIDVIEEPAPGVFVVTEYESVRTGTPTWPGRESKRDGGPGTEEQ